jgi:hypothetical protein
VVAGGIFRGLKYCAKSIGSQYDPKLLGCYELELQRTLAGLFARPWKKIINVGGGEGYYACGCASQAPDSAIDVFEASAEGQGLIRQMAELNRVADRVRVAGVCSAADLARSVGSGDATLIIMDVEGAEDQLLDPATIPALRHCVILVELHEFLIPDLGPRLEGRFQTTHRICSIWAENRTWAALPYPRSWFLRGYLGRHLLAYTDEARPGNMRWWLLEPK